MHLLATASTSIDELADPVDLRQTPGDIAVLSFADSDLSALASAWAAEEAALPSLRLAHLRDLRHPMSVDLWIDRVGRSAKIIVVRLLGGLDWWRYGIERLSVLAREEGIALAVLPGEDRDDPRLTEASTLPARELSVLLQYFRAGGPQNLRAMLRRLAHYAGRDLNTAAPQPMPAVGAYTSTQGALDLDELIAGLPPGAPVVPIVFYRANLLAADTAPIDALSAALAARGLAPVPLFVGSLKDQAAREFLRTALARLNPAVVVTATAFAASGDDVEPSPLDATDAPVLQVVMALTKRAAWQESARGLGASDLAMHVVLPELDGRILAGAISFKEPSFSHSDLGFTALSNHPEPDRVALVADRIGALVRLRATRRSERRVAILMPDYPGAPGRAGYAVGLDVPASTVALMSDLAAAGYSLAEAPATSTALLESIEENSAESVLPLSDYFHLRSTLSHDLLARVDAAWGNAKDDPDASAEAFHFRARRFGNVVVGFAPDRGSTANRRADYHDPALPPRHALIAFGLWLRHVQDIHALVHMGAHGSLEWLPGKAVALSASCFPEAIVGPLPVIYPFIVSNPGEAAQAKRRIGAVTIGHLPPPLTTTELSGAARELEQLVDEYAQAHGLDQRRRGKLASLIVETAQRNGLAREAGLDPRNGADALRCIDAWLCDLKELAIKDGLHIYGRPHPQAQDSAWASSTEAERSSIIRALDGKRVAAGPAGAPGRGRRDVLPTGRNLFTADPRMLPTQTATELGRLAADEVIRNYVQTHGEMPRSLVLDLWGSATLRTGGEEIAQGLSFMGCRPTWDSATGRVTGVEVLPTASIGRPRVDVSWRISGLFRDLFPAQIAIIDAAVQTVAARNENDDDNPLVSARRHENGRALGRIFSCAPGRYGAGAEEELRGALDRDAVGAAYLDAASFAYGGAEGAGSSAPGAFAARIAGADLLVHPGDDPSRDLLEGDADVASIGGFSAAASSLDRSPDLIVLDTTDPERPRARPLAAALARIVRGRAVNPRFIEGQMRHGPRGAAEFAETVDRLVAFAATTNAVTSELIDLLYEAYVADTCVREFILRENLPAARAIAERFEQALRTGLWHPRRNDIGIHLSKLRTEAGP
jgi:cobaltochelatase CobN